MKHSMNNEKGYTLFLTLLITILFTILAFLMVTFTMSGMEKNNVREEYVQAQELSEKGLEHITSEINSQLQEKLGEDGLIRTHFVDELDALLERYHCYKGNEKIIIDSKTGKYEACVEYWGNTITADGSENDLRKEVVFLSKGNADGKEKEIRTTVEIGAKEVPDALKYAIGSHKTCKNNRNCIPGEGNLYLHGGVSIEGDFKVDGHLVTSSKGVWLSLDRYGNISKEHWVDSVYPSALPGPNAKTSKLVLGGNMYTFNGWPHNGYNYHINRDNFGGYKLSQVKNAFTTPPQLVNREPIVDRFTITDQKDNYYLSKNDSSVKKVYADSDLQLKDKRESGKKGYAYHQTAKKVKVSNRGCGLFGLSPCYDYITSDESKGNYYMSGNNIFGQLAIDGDLTIFSGKHTFQNGLYVEGDLIIGNISRRTPNLSVELDGPIFVNGNLIIQGVNAKLNTLIYVNKAATIEHSRINGLNKNGKDGSLIIFANNQIRIVNNSVNEDVPSNIRGYFYSDDAFEMFGVGSNIRIDGGISARRIVLNAVRGSASEDRWGNYYFDSVSEQKHKDSRLQVIYNPEIINTYSDLKQQEPVIYEVDPPKVIERN